MAKIVTRIMGGIGNQLFCYAAARRLALVNHAELVIDDVTGFSRDRVYRRRYMLDHFNISARKATNYERMEPFERYRRGLAKYISKKLPFFEREYIEQERIEFDPRFLEYRTYNNIYIDGLWQSENYFKDVEDIIRDDLKIIPPTDLENINIAKKIKNIQNTIAMHVRWFDLPGINLGNNVSTYYYHRAIAMMEQRINAPHYFLFSDNLEAVHSKLDLPEGRVTFVSNNDGDDNAYADLWLMSQCKHFITANSTFSWWGAWLGESRDSVVLVPRFSPDGGVTSWCFTGLIPERWEQVSSIR